MAESRSFLPGSRRLIFLLLHVACVFFFPAATSTNQPPAERRKTSPSASSAAKSHGSSSVRSYLRHVLSFYRSNNKQEQSRPTSFPISPSSSLHKQLRHYLVYPERTESVDQKTISRPVGVAKDAAAGSVKRSSFTSRADVFPCVSCGEIFNKVHILDLHQATKHAFSELLDGDAGKNIVRIIFQSGWKRSSRGSEVTAPAIHRILKIHHSSRTLALFEEYRDAVRSRAFSASRVDGSGERCAVDGNESLRFYCATFLCQLGRNGNTGSCGSPFCTACWIVRHGFSGKEVEGISMHATGSGAHASLPEELEREFAFMRVRRAMLVCRVVAGRVRLRKAAAAAAEVGEQVKDRGYDSVVARAREEGEQVGMADELLVFNPRAALPCFVVVYGV
ncbi:unnamed protein product [Spirodela intermedia]|uniref:C2H2-type domain-containing protein n=1 Tax=Spirodela intermedia TaxID=51605 RepID=A0A7I8KJW3_SPIIN|nr:unnamed protein product [Spirodela intermedia]